MKMANLRNSIYFTHFCYSIIHWCHLPTNFLFGKVELGFYTINPTVSYTNSKSLSLNLRWIKKMNKNGNIVTILSNACLLRLKSSLNLTVICLSIIYVNLSPSQFSKQKLIPLLSAGYFGGRYFFIHYVFRN